MRELIERGFNYVAQPPLYKIKRKLRERYVDNDDQLNEILLELGIKNMTRFVPKMNMYSIKVIF